MHGKRIWLLAVVLGMVLGGCAAMTQPIEVTPPLIEALGKDSKSVCYVNQGKADSLMYGTGTVTSTFCRLGADQGSVSVDRQGVISITHGPQAAPVGNLPVNVAPMTLAPVPTK